MNPAEWHPVDDATYLQIQRFLFREAALLDSRDYASWLALTTDDIRYRVNAMVSRDAGVAAVDYAIIDEDQVGLKSRIDQISNPRLTRAENPPSMTRRVVSNIEAYDGASAEQFQANSYLLASRQARRASRSGDTVRRCTEHAALRSRQAPIGAPDSGIADPVRLGIAG